jgi:hypothetical protein
MNLRHVRITSVIAGTIVCTIMPALALAQSGSGAYCPQLSTSIQRGSRDGPTEGQVTELQHFLSTYYSINPSTIMTGYFGPITQKYAIEFQQGQTLPA